MSSYGDMPGEHMSHGRVYSSIEGCRALEGPWHAR